VIQHIVLFNPKDGLTVEAKRSFAQSTLNVVGRSPHVSRFTVGRRVEVDAGYTRSFGDKTYEYAAVLEFVGADELVSYLNSPEHAELGRLFWEMCGSAVIVEVDASSPAIDGIASMLV
jgi:hypothetical protein